MVTSFDLGAWEERAAIMEFDGGLSRFEAETLAAQAQGVSRHDAIRIGNLEAARNNDAAAIGDAANNLPRVQPAPGEENGPVPIGDVQAKRDSLALLALPIQRGGIL